VGDEVRVVDGTTLGAWQAPSYAWGRRGTILAVRNVEDLPRTTNLLPKLRLYQVRFLQVELNSEYSGNRADSVTTDIFEHWLEAT
jgi:hypothetical protein